MALVRLARQQLTSVRCERARFLSCSTPQLRNDRGASTQPAAPKYYELRTYSIRRSEWDEFIRLSTEKLHMRFAASKCNVYLCANPGADPGRKAWNEVTHIWEYDDLVQRAGVRKELAGNALWMAEYLKPLLDNMAGHQSNSVILPVPWWPLRPSADAGHRHFAVRRTQMHPGQSAAWSVETQRQLAGAAGDRAPLGVWATDIGELDSAHELYCYASHDALVEHQQKRDRDVTPLDGVLVKDRQWKAYELAPWSQWSA